ncbi:MAG TPA: tetratricopeptide repeat protein [Saprospiraceae bacterium]|nr:tetratricopeptide repeat protein [Saprospiraceae bacterium]HNG90495.1 tetratricopeptide repeat protein [Saprospiraceae bacterium]
MKHRTLLLLALALLVGAGAFFLLRKKPQPKVPEVQLELQNDPRLLRLNALLAEDPKNDSLLYRRAAAYYDLDAYDEAIADLQQAIQLDSTHPAYYHLLADSYLDYARPNDSKNAINAMLAAAHKFPERIPTLLKLSEVQLIVRQHSDALGTLDKVLQRDPQNGDAYFMTGRIALDMSDTTRAIVAFKKAVQYDATLGEAWMFLGQLYTALNNPQALQCFDNVLRLDSTDLEAREYKGVFHKRRGEYAKAFAVYRDIVVRNPDYANAYFDMGIMYLDQDSLQKAYDHFSMATKTDPLFVKAYYYRGVSSEEMGNQEAALADYRQANKMSPGYKEAKEAKERLEKK